MYNDFVNEYGNSSVLYKKLNEEKKIDVFLDDIFEDIPVEDYLCDYKSSMEKLRNIETDVSEGYNVKHSLPFLQITEFSNSKHEIKFHKNIKTSICVKDARFIITECGYYVETHFFYYSKYGKGVWLGFGNTGDLYVLNNKIE